MSHNNCKERFGFSLTEVLADAKHNLSMREGMADVGRDSVTKTALGNEYAPLIPGNIADMGRLLRTMAPLSRHNWQTHWHIHTTALMGYAFGIALSEQHCRTIGTNPVILAIVGYGHDVGRFITHRLGQHDVEGKKLLRELGFRTDVLTYFGEPESFYNRSFGSLVDLEDPDFNPERSLSSLQKKQWLLMMADMCGKRQVAAGAASEFGGFFSFQHVLQYHLTSRQPEKYSLATGQTRPIRAAEMIAVAQMNTSLGPGDQGETAYSTAVYKAANGWLRMLGVDSGLVQMRVAQLEDKYDLRRGYREIWSELTSGNPTEGTLKRFEELLDSGDNILMGQPQPILMAEVKA